MGDYVLESNPALERLIERLRAPEEPPPPEECLSPNGDEQPFRRRRRSKAHLHHAPFFRGEPTDARAKDVTERALAAEPAVIVEEEPAPVEDNLWAVHEDAQRPDEMILVDFDEEPEVFDEDPEDIDEDENDEADEFLDIYGDEEGDDEEAASDDGLLAEADVVVDEDEGTEVVAEEDVFLDEDEDEDAEADDEALAEIVGDLQDVELDDETPDESTHGRGDWMLDAFEAWRRESAENGVAEDEEDLEAEEDLEVFDEDLEVLDGWEIDEDEDNAVDDELIDVFDEDIGDPVDDAPPLHDEFEVVLLESSSGYSEPDHPALSALSSQLSANAGRKKARHRKRSPRQKKRSLKKAEQEARKAEKSSLKATAKSSKVAQLPHVSQTELRTAAPFGAIGAVASR